MKFSQFKKKLSKLSPSDRVLIFMHDYPDPDSLTSAALLSNLFEHFGAKSKIVYSGEIVRVENQKMVQDLKLKIHLYRLGEETNFQYTALVDTNQYISNHQFPKEQVPDFTFDHHVFKIEKKSTKLDQAFEKFYEINTEYGSCSSIIMEYLLHFKVPLSKELSTAFCYTLLAETNHFERDFGDEDIRLYRQTIQSADLRSISQILNIQKPLLYFNTLRQGLNKYKIDGKTISCSLGKVESIEMIHQVADFLLRQENIDTTVVTGYVNPKEKKVCTRSRNKKIHIGKLLKKALNNMGQGGGHKNMAAGIFEGSEKNMILNLMELLPK